MHAMKRSRFAVLGLGFVALAALAACNDKPLVKKNADAGPPPGGLTAEQAGHVLAKVGDKSITLGDFAAAIERMDQFDRLRYQTKERRRELLNEMIDVELLAAEAKKRGLDKAPETEEAIRQVMRDALLAETRLKLPSPAEIPAEEVHAYFKAHADKFREPERRRVAAIVLTDKKRAEDALEQAQKAKSGTQWGELFFKYSVTAPKKSAAAASPLDLAGDLGIVGPPTDAKGANPRVPEPLRSAVFKIDNVGGVLGELVEIEGKYFVVRMNGITAGHERTLAEADRTIRVALLQEKMQANEVALEAELRKKFPVTIDDKALASVKLPAAIEKMDATTTASQMAREAMGGATPPAASATAKPAEGPAPKPTHDSHP
jgi:hypothetical protein